MSTARWLSVTLLAVSAATFTLSPALAQTTAFHANGATASIQSFMSNPEVFLSVARGSVEGQASTYLQLLVYLGEDSSGNVISKQAYGTIPNSSFSVKSALGTMKSTATLSVDTSKVGGGFVNLDCERDAITYQDTCVPGNGGIVAAVITSDPYSDGYSSSGVFTQTGGGVQYTNTGNSEFIWATANLSVFGVTVTGPVNATIGTNHNTTITIVRK